MARGFGGGIYTDPAFQMGMALGNAYGNLWASNAENRNREQMRELMRNQTGQLGENEIAQIAAMGDTQGLNPGTANTVEAAITNTAQQDPAAAYRQRLFAAGNATPQRVTAGVNGNIPGSYVAGTGNNSIDEALNRIQRQDQLRRAGGANQNPLFSADDIAFAAQMAGINQEVIDDFMPGLQKQAASRARETLLPGIINDSYGYTNASGEYVPPDYRAALEGILELGKYDPETANKLMSGAISSKDIYNNQQQERERMLGDESYMRRLQMQDAVKAQAEEREFNRTVDMLAKYGGVSRDDAARYILYGGNNSRRSNNGTYNIGKNSNGSRQSLINSPEFKYASEQLAALDEITANGEQLTPEQEALRRRLQPYVNSVINSIYQLTPETYNGSADNDEVQYNGPVLNDYSYSMRDWTKALERNANAGNERWSRQKMINYARQKYGDNADAILRDTNWEAFGF